MSEISLPKPFDAVIQARKELEKNIREVVTNNLRLAEGLSQTSQKVGVKKPKPLSLNNIIYEIKSDSRGLDEMSDGRLRAKVLEEIILRSADNCKNSHEQLNTLIVLNDSKKSEVYFAQLTKFGNELGFPDMTEDIKKRIIFGVQNLTKDNVKNIDLRNDIWARIVTQKQYKQMKFSTPTIVIQA